MHVTPIKCPLVVSSSFIILLFLHSLHPWVLSPQYLFLQKIFIFWSHLCILSSKQPIQISLQLKNKTDFYNTLYFSYVTAHHILVSNGYELSSCLCAPPGPRLDLIQLILPTKTKTLTWQVLTQSFLSECRIR